MTSAFQQRVMIEQVELSNRLDKLSEFLKSPIFESLPDAERLRLTRQSVAMHDYLNVLTERITANFS